MYLLYKIIQKGCPPGIRFKHFRINRRIGREIFRIGIPSSLYEMSVAFGTMLILGRVNTFGPGATASHGTGIRFYSLLYLLITAIFMYFMFRNKKWMEKSIILRENGPTAVD